MTWDTTLHAQVRDLYLSGIIAKSEARELLGLSETEPASDNDVEGEEKSDSSR